MPDEKFKKGNAIIFIVFFIVFWCVFFLDDAINFFSSSANNTYTAQFDTASPNNSTEINGQKINVLNGMVKIPGDVFANKIKEEISLDPKKQLIHFESKANRYFITYKFNEKTVSALILDSNDGTARYQIYKSGGKLTDGGQLPDSKIPVPPDAVSLINLKGQKGKVFFSYNSYLTPEEVKGFYRKVMKKRGWSEEEFKLPPRSSLLTSHNQYDTEELIFMKNRKSFVVSIKIDPESEFSMVTICN